MDSSRESSPDPLHQANVGTMDYPYALPENGREAGIHMWQMQRETVLAICRMEELLCAHDQWLEALEGTSRKITARTKDLRTMRKDQHIGLQQIHTAVHAIYYPDQSPKGKERLAERLGLPNPPQNSPSPKTKKTLAERLNPQGSHSGNWEDQAGSNPQTDPPGPPLLPSHQPRISLLQQLQDPPLSPLQQLQPSQN
jgi:hypothetical protein